MTKMTIKELEERLEELEEREDDLENWRIGIADLTSEEAQLPEGMRRPPAREEGEEDEGEDVDIWNPPDGWEEDPFLKEYIPYRCANEGSDEEKKIKALKQRLEKLERRVVAREEREEHEKNTNEKKGNARRNLSTLGGT